MRSRSRRRRLRLLPLQLVRLLVPVAAAARAQHPQENPAALQTARPAQLVRPVPVARLGNHRHDRARGAIQLRVLAVGVRSEAGSHANVRRRHPLPDRHPDFHFRPLRAALPGPQTPNHFRNLQGRQGYQRQTQKSREVVDGEHGRHSDQRPGFPGDNRLRVSALDPKILRGSLLRFLDGTQRRFRLLDFRKLPDQVQPFQQDEFEEDRSQSVNVVSMT